ncbi:MRG/MORF4L-binding protein [Syngnathoides biaculeatus]|uniref:MRG/MORF4L-binding protein n=1 Tax=Syngnathoides biaculeatus TaxID=300417 RepID=UPI002ADD3AD0|nr:MRG/MORF4L-binding protein [Syngnathoides biaculeatus]
MGEADVTQNQSDEKPPDTALAHGEESVVWSHEVEVCLFHAMIGHKPVGVNRHFHMICIRDKFSQNIGRQISSSVIWDHLGSMYDMQALHESEILPFPNSEKSFFLPDYIIQEVKEGKVFSEEEPKGDPELEREPPAMYEEGSNSSLKMSERTSSGRDKEKGGVEGVTGGGAGAGGGGKEVEKRKRSRGAEKLLSTSNPASPGGAKRRRT